MSILCIGEMLLDKPQDQAETLAGAPLNVAVALKRLGTPAILISAVGPDESGRWALQQLRSLGISTEFVRIVEDSRTGLAHVHLDALGNPSYSIARPAAFDFLTFSDEQQAILASQHPDWLYYGTLAQTSHKNEQLLSTMMKCFSGISCFYDLNLRDQQWDFALVQRLAGAANVLKLNHDEAEILSALDSGGTFSLESFCNSWSTKYQVPIICITLGNRGCAIFAEGALELYPGFPTTVVDTVGAGDAFTAAFLHGLRQEWPLKQIARFANALGSVVASRATAIPEWTIHDIDHLLR